VSSQATTEPLALVLEVLHAVLGADVPLAADTELLEVRGFDSMALAALVDGLEDRLGMRLADELIVPDVFATPGLIAGRLVGPALSGEVS